MAIDDRVDQLLGRLALGPAFEQRGQLKAAVGTSIRVSGIIGRIGDLCELADPMGQVLLQAEIVGLAGEDAILAPLGDLRGLSCETEVLVRPGRDAVPVSDAMLGRVLDARLLPLDGREAITAPASLPLHAPAPNPMERQRIATVLETGIRAVDGLLTIGCGQRVGVFAAAGVGKSTLLAVLARQARADVAVIALVGERGREVREFIEDNLGSTGLARSVVIAATSDRPALERARAAHAATAIAEGFRAQGKHVLLMMDSVTRFARALREIGLAAGEQPVRRGFPPSIFAELPRLFERAGTAKTGAITGIYTVLLEDEEEDPVGEEVRSLLDGHIQLSRALAAKGHYPAIDVLASQSRLFDQLADGDQRRAAAGLRAMLAKLEDIELLLQMGDYKPGEDPLADRAIALREQIGEFLRQPAEEPCDTTATLALLRAFAA